MITMDNYEGWLMRYTDGELNDTERAEVERFLQGHPELKEELAEVCSVKVTAPVATLPGKETLLHKEGVIFSPVWRAAAAVTLLLVAGGITLLLNKRSEENPLVAKVEKVRQDYTDTLVDVSPLQGSKATPSPDRGLAPTANNCRPLTGTPEPSQGCQNLAVGVSPRCESEEIYEPRRGDTSTTLPHLRGGVLVVETDGLVQQEAQLATINEPSTLEKIQEFFMRPE